ncbi:toxin glutamine deamidase domain-containing protein [Kitasatospora sp. NPDC001159]
MSYSSIDPGPRLASFFGVVAGSPWPQANEGGLREIRDAYEQLAKDLPDLRRLIATVAIKARQEFEGEAAQQFSVAMNQFIGVGGGDDYVSTAADTAKALADCAGDVANSVEYTKWMAIAQLVDLLFEIALATFWAPFTFGADFAGLSIKYFFTREALWLLLKYLIKTILMHTFTGLVKGILMDSIIQGIQMSHGDRHTYDMEAFKQSVLNGVIGGLISGPVSVFGMGLGKLIGSLVGKSGGSVLAKELESVLKNGDKEALKHLLDTATKHAGSTALADLEKAGAKSIGKGIGEGLGEGAGKGVGKGIGKGVGESAGEGLGKGVGKNVGKGVGEGASGTAGKVLSDAEAKAFAKSIGKEMKHLEPFLKEGFGKGGAGSIAEKFSENFAGSFEKHLGGVLGKDAANNLGKEYAEAFVAGWTKHGAANDSLSVVLRSILDHGGSDLGEHGISALADHLPNLAAHMGEGNRLYRLGAMLGEQLVEGAQGNLSEGLYNLIFDDKHQFTTSANTFGAGVAMGLLGKGVHHVLHLTGVGHKWAAYIEHIQVKALEEGKGAYFPAYHPLTLLSLASNLAGHAAPFPVPRLGPSKEVVNAGHVLAYSRGLGGAPDVEYAALFAKAFGQADLETLFADPAPKLVPTTSGGGSTTSKSKQDLPGTGGGKVDRPAPVRTEGGTAKDFSERPKPARTDSSWSGTTLVDDPARPGRTVGGAEETKHATATSTPEATPERPRPPRTTGGGPEHSTTDVPQPPSRRRGRDEYEGDGGDNGRGDHGGADLPPLPEPPAKRPRPEETPVPRPLDSFLHEFSDGGHTAPGPAARHALEQAVAGPDGPKKFAHPQEFVELINPHGGGSLLKDVNCVAAAMAFHSTFRGDPQVAPGLSEPHPGAAGDAQHWTGHSAEYVGLGDAGLDEVALRVAAGGPGSAAIVLAWTEDGRGHAWNLVNVPGDGLVWVDAQQGLHSPGDRPLPKGVTRVWAIAHDADNWPLRGDGPFNAAADHPAERSARPTPADAFTGTDGPAHPVAESSHAEPPPAQSARPEPAFAPPGERVPVAGDGLCLLNSVAVSSPGIRMTPDAMKRAVSDHLTKQGPANLPAEVIHNYRKAATRSLSDTLLGRSRDQLLNDLLDLGVAGVDTHEVVPTSLLRDRYVTALTRELAGPGGDTAAARAQAERSVQWKFKGPEDQAKAESYLRGLGKEPAADPHALREQYIDERVAHGEQRAAVQDEIGWNLAEGAVSPQKQFEYLADKPEAIGLHDLSAAGLADLQVWHRTRSDLPLSPQEFAGLHHAVENWESSWWKGFGDTFPPLAADALGLRLCILGPDGHGGSTEYARFGPTDGHQVTVYYNGTNHYDGSRPPAPTPAVSGPASKRPAEHDGPVLPPVPHSVPTVSGADRPGSTGESSKPAPEAKPAPKPDADGPSKLTVPSASATGPKHEHEPEGKSEAEHHPKTEAQPKPDRAAKETPAGKETQAPTPPEAGPHRPEVPSIIITEAEHDPLRHPEPPASPPASVLSMSVFSTESGGSHDHPYDDPAFTPKKPLGPDELRLPPARVANHRRLSASDLVVGLHHGDTAVHEQIVKLFESTFKNDLPAARTVAKDFFAPAALRPQLTALSRGDVWEVRFEANGWSGKISVRVDVDELVHQDTAPNVEFENGSDRYASVGLQEDALNRLNAALQAKAKVGKTDFTETLGYQHDSLTGSTSVEVGRSISRGKTVEPGALFSGKLHLALDFSELTHNGEPVATTPGERVQRLDIGATIGIPVRDTLDVHGNPVPPAKDKLFAPPQRIVDGHRLGGSDIVLDVSTHRHGRPDADHPMQEILDGVEHTAEEALGDLWPALREKMTAELDTTRLQQDLKSMMSGEPTRIEVTDKTGFVTGSVEITASVKAMWQHGNTPQTEFNVGTGVQRVRTEQESRSNGLQLPLPGVVSGAGVGTSIGSGGGGLQLIKDKVRISGSSQEVLLTTKTKGPGVVYDGRVELTLKFEKDSPLGKSGDTARTTVDFRTLVEQAEAHGVKDTGAGDPTLFVATEEPQPHRPKTFSAGTAVPSPPDSVWRRPDGTGGGFGDTTTVRDLPTVAPLHHEVERLGQEVLGAAWKDVKHDVHQLFSHPMVASHLTSMTRGTRMELPEQTAAALFKYGVKVSATAHVTELDYKRPNAKAELNPVDETSAFKSGRKLLSDTKSVQGSGGGTAALTGKNTMDASGGYSRQVRDRDGWRDGSAQKAYANGKYARPQEIYDAGLGVEVKLTVDGKDHTVTVPIRAEVSLDAKETGRYTVGEDGHAHFTGPGAGTPVTHQPPAEQHDPPRRITERGALSASDVVHSLGDGGGAVLGGIEHALGREFGSVPDDVMTKVRNRFDEFALKPQLSKLTRGGKLTEHVSIHGWDTTITVTVGLGRDFRHTDTVDKFEFEKGTRTQVTTGSSKDRRIRDALSGIFRFKLPYADLGLNLARRNDFAHGSAVDTTGATVSKGKTVEPAGLFTGTAEFTIHIESRKLGQEVTAPDHTVPVHTTVAVPLRDAPPHGATEAAPLKKPLDPPARIERTHRLGSSDVVTDVYPLRPRGGGPGGSEHGSVGDSAVAGIGRRGAKALGSDWPGMKAKILDELDVTRLQPQLKSMMAGHEIVVKHGRSTVRITAAVSRLEHTGETAQTEFNTGTQVQKTVASSDGVTSYGSGHGNTVTVSLQGTSNPLPVGPAVTAGGSVTHSWGRDQLDVQAQRSTAGVATKAKLPGSEYTGEATLYFRMERRPLLPLGDPNRLVPPGGDHLPGTAFEHVKSAAGQAWRDLRKLGTTVHTIDTAKIGFETSIEAGEGRASKGPKPTPFEEPEHRTAPAPQPAPVEPPVEKVVKAPPARVWDEGLRDIDVMRWLGDAGGVQDILRLRGREFFGTRTWDRMESLARNTTDHAQLSSHFGSATRGEELGTPSPGRRPLVSDGGVKVNLKVLQLEYDRTDGKVELSPSNATSTSSTKTKLDWSLWGGQVQGGVKTDLGGAEGTFQAVVGGSHRDREGLSLGNSGQVVSHAKFNTPMARYDGFAEVEVVFFKGDKEVVEKGVIPITVDIPERETTDAKVMSDHYLAFSAENPDGWALPKHPPAKPEGEAAPGAGPAATAEPKQESKPGAEPKPQSAPKPEPTSEATPKPESELRPKVPSVEEDVFRSLVNDPPPIGLDPGHSPLPEGAPKAGTVKTGRPTLVEGGPVHEPLSATIETTVEPEHHEPKLDESKHHEPAHVPPVEGPAPELPEPHPAPERTGGGPKLSDVLPESSWWRLFIDANVHQEALSLSPTDAANHLDRTKYPGFRQSMTELFHEVLDGKPGGRDWSVVDVHAYEQIHDLATRHLVEGSGSNVATVWSGSKDGLLTTMRGTGRTTMAADLHEDVINGRPLVVDFTLKSGSLRDVKPPLVAFQRGSNGEGMISINYAHEEAPGHVQAVLDRYYHEIAGAPDDRAKLVAIAKVTRALQMMQPFTDANSRVNVSVLMQKFLLEQGFRPAVLTNSFELFLGGYTTHEIADHLVEGMARFDKYAGGSIGDQFNTEAGPSDHALISSIGDAVGLPAGTAPGDAAVQHHRVLDLVRLGRSLYGDGVPSLDPSGVQQLRTVRQLSDLAHAKFPSVPTSTAVASYAHHLHGTPGEGMTTEHLKSVSDAVGATLAEGHPLTEDNIRARMRPVTTASLSADDLRKMRGFVEEESAWVPVSSGAGAKVPWDAVKYQAPEDGKTPARFDVHELSGGAPLTADGLAEKLMPKLSSLDMGSFRLVLRAEDGALGADPIAVVRQTADMFMAPVDLLVADHEGVVRLVSFDDFGRHGAPEVLELDHSAAVEHPAEHPTVDTPTHLQPEHKPDPEHQPDPEHKPEPEHNSELQPEHRPEDRVHEMTEALVNAHQGFDVRWLADPDSPAAQLHETGSAVSRFPKDPRFFAVAFHSEHADGAPTWHGERVGPEELADVLVELRKRGIWEAGKPLQFPACEFGTGKASSYASEVLRALRGRVDGPLEAYVPEGKLWFVPKPTGPFTVESEGPGHLVVAKAVGFDANGLPVVVPGGKWLKVEVPEAFAEHPQLADHPGEVHVTELGAHLPVGEDLPPHHQGVLDGFAEASDPSVLHEIPGATAFGPKPLIYSTSEYAAATVSLEKKLGEYCFNLPEAKTAAATALGTLRDMIRKAYPEASPAEHLSALLKDDPTSAGQVGTALTEVQFDQLLASGNLREVMTAFFNGVFFKDSPLNLKTLLNTIVEHKQWDRAKELGLNVEALKQQREFLDGALRKSLHEGLGLAKPKFATMFEKDVFATGNVLAQSKSWFSDGVDYVSSIRSRMPRPENEVPTPSARELEGLGLQLSRREMEFLKVDPMAWELVGIRPEEVPTESLHRLPSGEYDLGPIRTEAGVLGVYVESDPETGESRVIKLVEYEGNPLRPGEIGPDEPLSWRTGEAVHQLDHGTSWYKSVNGDQGMRVVAGISATAAKMMTAFKLLNIDESHADNMVKALFGWMLPVSDHSVYEILKGVEATGATMPLNPKALKSAEGMYRNLPGIEFKEVRRLLGDQEGMLPHEQVYAAKARATLPGGGFGEPGEFNVNTLDGRRRIFELLADRQDPSGYDTDDVERVKRWLATNGKTPQEVLDALTPAHFYALAAYTGPAFPLINVMMRPGGSIDRVLLIQIEHVLRGTEFPQVLASHPAISDLVGRRSFASKADEAAHYKQMMTLVKKEVLPGLKAEMREHTRMLKEALDLLPGADGRVYRGTASISFKKFTGFSPVYGGSEIVNKDFSSASRRYTIAEKFMNGRKTFPGLQKTMVTMNLKGDGAGKDISAFSVQIQEDEVLGVPGAKHTIIQRRLGSKGELHIDALEASSSKVFASPTQPGTPRSAALRATDAELEAHLAHLSGERGLDNHKDLWALGVTIGVPNADKLGSAAKAFLFMSEKEQKEIGLRTWHVARLAADIHGGAGMLTVSGLTTMRRVTDVVREGLGLKTGTVVDKEHLDGYVRQLRGADQNAKVEPAERLRLIKLVESLKEPDSHSRVTSDAVTKAWNAQAPGTLRTPRFGSGSYFSGTPGTPGTPHTPGRPGTPMTPGTPSGHELRLPDGPDSSADQGRTVLSLSAPLTRQARIQTQAAISLFPKDTRFLAVAMHTTDGYPTYRGEAVLPGTVADLLLAQKNAGDWDGAKPVQFVACRLGYGVSTSYAAQVMSALWEKDPTITAPGYAGDGIVWFVPKVDQSGTVDETAHGYLVVADKVGMTTTGRPGISTGANWYRFERPTDGTFVPVVHKLGPYLPPGGDSAPRPENYFGVKDAKDFAENGDIRGAVPFRQGPPDAGLADQIFQELIK